MRRGGDARGGSPQRRSRKRWLLSAMAGFGGNGHRAPCYWCSAPLTFATVEADRWPVPGRDGGRYIRENVVPACRKCNAPHALLRAEHRFYRARRAVSGALPLPA